MQGGDGGAVVDKFAVAVGALQQRAEYVVLRGITSGGDDEFNAQEGRAGLQHVQRLHKYGAVDEKAVAGRLACAAAHAHCFGGGGGFVEQGCVGDGQAGEVGDHVLKVQQHFQPPLGDFRLIRRVGGVPAGVFKDVAQQHGRQVRAVIALADERVFVAVVRKERAQAGEGFGFRAGGGQRQRRAQADVLRHGLVDEFCDAVAAEGGEHFALGGLVNAEVTGDEFIVAGQFLIGGGQQLGGGDVVHGGSWCDAGKGKTASRARGGWPCVKFRAAPARV